MSLKKATEDEEAVDEEEERATEEEKMVQIVKEEVTNTEVEEEEEVAKTKSIKTPKPSVNTQPKTLHLITKTLTAEVGHEMIEEEEAEVAEAVKVTAMENGQKSKIHKVPDKPSTNTTKRKKDLIHLNLKSDELCLPLTSFKIE